MHYTINSALLHVVQEKIMKIRVNYGKTVNLGNYESKRIDLSLEKDINEIEQRGYRVEMIRVYKELETLAENILKGEFGI